MSETVSMTRILVVPGLAVRTYVERPVAHLRATSTSGPAACRGASHSWLKRRPRRISSAYARIGARGLAAASGRFDWSANDWVPEACQLSIKLLARTEGGTG
jgi:hypothetical protein